METTTDLWTIDGVIFDMTNSKNIIADRNDQPFFVGTYCVYRWTTMVSTTGLFYVVKLHTNSNTYTTESI